VTPVKALWLCRLLAGLDLRLERGKGIKQFMHDAPSLTYSERIPRRASEHAAYLRDPLVPEMLLVHRRSFRRSLRLVVSHCGHVNVAS
jgi:hypothetical protein